MIKVQVIQQPTVSVQALRYGLKGFSAYEIAVQNGFVGTEAQWLASLVGGLNSITGTNGRITINNANPQNPVIDIDLAYDTMITTALSLKEDISNKGIPGGYASLDGAGKIVSSQLPALAITDTYIVNSQAAQLALTAEEGDVAIRTDTNISYIHNGGVSGTMTDWQELLAPNLVTSVNGLTGAVPLTGTANRITVSAANVFDISSSYVGQSSITTVGTLTAGATGSGFTLDFGTSALAGSIPTLNTDAKIKGSVSASSTAIVLGNGTADTVTTSSNLNYTSAGGIYYLTTGDANTSGANAKGMLSNAAYTGLNHPTNVYLFVGLNAKLTAGSTGVSVTGTFSASGLTTITSTTEQLRVAYDATNYCKTTISSAGNATFELIGSGTPDFSFKAGGITKFNTGSALGFQALPFSTAPNMFSIGKFSTTNDIGIWYSSTQTTSNYALFTSNGGGNTTINGTVSSCLGVNNAFKVQGFASSVVIYQPLAINANGTGTQLTPGSQAHLNGANATATWLKITNGTTTGTTSSDGFDIGISSTGVAELRQRENLALEMYTNNTLRQTITAGGVTQFAGNIELTQTVTTESVVSDTTVTIVINGTTYKLLAKA